MTRKSGGVVMRVGPESCGAPSWQHAEGSREREKERKRKAGGGRKGERAKRVRVVPFSCLSSFSIFRPRSSLPLPVGPCPRRVRALSVF